MLGLGLRLAAWRWHEQVPLGGDEQEYFNQALTFLRDHRYVELNFMRPPAYTVFLSAAMYLFDSLVQRLRLIQAIISTLTILPIYAFTQELFGKRNIALLAALLMALNYTLASTATELLTETLFMFGLSMLLWLLAASGRTPRLLFPILAGITLGALILTRSVALPLLGMGVLWLLLGSRATGARQADPQTDTEEQLASLPRHPSSLPKAVAFLLTTLLILLPWTARNYLTYNAFILVDTTGAENLWLDNDPAGREAVKAQLYALGEQRALRQSLASQRGMAVIMADPARFMGKAWGEAQRFMALEHFDDMRARRAIWLPPTEVWLRLLLGDGLGLLTMLAGVIGLWTYRPQTQQNRYAAPLLALWCLYILFTSILFHVELRYRLPVYPALIPFAAAVLIGIRGQQYHRSWIYSALAAVTCLLLLALMLLHRNYPAEAMWLTSKHMALFQAEQAFKQGLIGTPISTASSAANRALAIDPESALAHVGIARAAHSRGDTQHAQAALDQAIAILPAHPYAHLLRGAMLRVNGNEQEARIDLAFESASREDLQAWSWDSFRPFGEPPQQLEIGNGLDLGFVQGFHLPQDGYRWTKDRAQIRLYSATAMQTLVLELASGRPARAPAPQLEVLVNGRPIATLEITQSWQQYQIKLPDPVAGQVIIELRSPLFTPRSYDHTSGDARKLGIMVKAAELSN